MAFLEAELERTSTLLMLVLGVAAVGTAFEDDPASVLDVIGAAFGFNLSAGAGRDEGFQRFRESQRPTRRLPEAEMLRLLAPLPWEREASAA